MKGLIADPINETYKWDNNKMWIISTKVLRINNLDMLCILENTLTADCIVHFMVYYTLIMHLKPSGIEKRFRWLHLMSFPGMEHIFFAR